MNNYIRIHSPKKTGIDGQTETPAGGAKLVTVSIKRQSPVTRKSIEKKILLLTLKLAQVSSWNPIIFPEQATYYKYINKHNITFM